MFNSYCGPSPVLSNSHGAVENSYWLILHSASLHKEGRYWASGHKDDESYQEEQDIRDSKEKNSYFY